MYKPVLTAILLICVFTSYISCKGNQQREPLSAGSGTDTLKKTSMTSADFSSIDSLSLPEAIIRYGNPVKTDVFQVNDALPEDRIELYNFFPKKEYQKEKIIISECIWTYGTDKEYNITVWFIHTNNTPEFLHKKEWKKGTEF